MARRSTGREGIPRRYGAPIWRGCGGASILALLGLYLGYLFIAVPRSGISLVAGVLLVSFTAYLAWDYFRRSRRPGP